jgi:murein DD-endopeptidase MepM/ murein hydrolase activator NlpD
MIRRALVILIITMLGAPPAGASSLTEKHQELQQILQQLTHRRERLHEVRTEERRVLGQLERIDRSHDATARRLAGLTFEYRQTQARVQTVGQQLATTQRNLTVHQGRLRARLRDIYKYGQGSYLEVLLGTTNFAEFVSRWNFVSMVMRADRALITEVTADVTRYQYLHETLQTDSARLNTVISQTEASKRELEIQEVAKRTTLRQIQHERSAYERAVRELEANSRELEVLIRRLQTPRAGTRVVLARGVGALRWPADGPITSPFGIRRHPIFRITHLHTGVDIGALWGSPVLAAADGQVIHAGWFGGYGKLVVVDHGAGVSTLYAHLYEILVSPGASVRRGQVVGRVGSTGFSTGPHLHFEIRIDGQPIDPLSH